MGETKIPERTCHICGVTLYEGKCLSCGHTQCGECPLYVPKPAYEALEAENATLRTQLQAIKDGKGWYEDSPAGQRTHYSCNDEEELKQANLIIDDLHAQLHDTELRLKGLVEINRTAAEAVSELHTQLQQAEQDRDKCLLKITELDTALDTSLARIDELQASFTKAIAQRDTLRAEMNAEEK